MFSLRVLPWLSSRIWMSEAKVSIVPVAASVSGDGSASRGSSSGATVARSAAEASSASASRFGAQGQAPNENACEHGAAAGMHTSIFVPIGDVWVRFMGPGRDTPPRGRRLVTVRFSAGWSRSFPLALRSGG